MSVLERLVRPYQITEVKRGNLFIQRRAYDPLTEIEEPVTSVLEWSASTSVNEGTITEQQYGGVELKEDDEQKQVEIGRTEEERRVENPEDASQYVDVADMILLKMIKKVQELQDAQPPKVELQPVITQQTFPSSADEDVRKEVADKEQTQEYEFQSQEGE